MAVRPPLFSRTSRPKDRSAKPTPLMSHTASVLPLISLATFVLLVYFLYGVGRRSFPTSPAVLSSTFTPSAVQLGQKGVLGSPVQPIVRIHMTSPRASSMKPIATDLVEIFNRPDETSVKIPRIGLGVFQASPAETESAVKHALQLGYRHVDTAALYRNEAAVGRAVRASGVPREDIFITTKLWNSDHGYQKTLQACERSLSQLGMDYVDLYLVHSPMPKQLRLDTWRAMETILASGKARSIGVSNYGIHHLEELFANCKVRPAVNQIELHPYLTRQGLVKFCEEHQIVLQAYSPLAKGLRLKDSVLVEMGKRYQKTAAQVMVRWGMQKNFVVLPKSVKEHRIAENANVYDFEISPSDMLKLDSLNEGFVTGWDPTRGP